MLGTVRFTKKIFQNLVTNCHSKELPCGSGPQSLDAGHDFHLCQNLLELGERAIWKPNSALKALGLGPA